MPRVASATDGAAPPRPAKLLGLTTSPSKAKTDTKKPPTAKRTTYSTASSLSPAFPKEGCAVAGLKFRSGIAGTGPKSALQQRAHDKAGNNVAPPVGQHDDARQGQADSNHVGGAPGTRRHRAGGRGQRAHVQGVA